MLPRSFLVREEMIGGRWVLHCPNGIRYTMERKQNIMNLLEFQHGFDKWFELWEHESNSNRPMYKDTLGQECLQ